MCRVGRASALALALLALGFIPAQYAAAQDVPGDGSTTVRLAVPGTLNSDIGTSSDQDAYLVALVAGGTYRFDAERTSDNLDTTLGLYPIGHPNFAGSFDCNNATGVLVGDDDSGTGTNSRITWTATATGDHVLCVDQIGNIAMDVGTGNYRLTATVTTAPPPVQTATITSPATLALDEADLQGAALTVTLAGTEYETPLAAGQFTLTLSGGATGISVASVARDSATEATLTLAYGGTGVDAATTIAVTVADAAHTGTGNLTTATTVAVTATEVPDVPDDETTTERLAVPGTIDGTLESNNDKDVYLVALASGGVYQFETDTTDATLDTTLGLYPPGHMSFGTASDDCAPPPGGSQRGVLARNNNLSSGVTNSRITWTATQTGDHLLCVDSLLTSLSSGPYTLTATVTSGPPPVQTATITSPATLALDEADLQGAALTVTLAGTEYETSPTAGQFTLTLTGGATGISVGSVTRDSATAATLTLAYGGTGVDAATTIAVTVADAAHTGAGDLTTATTVAVTATAAVALTFTGVTIPATLTFFRSVEVNLTLPAALGGVPPVTYELDGIGILTGLAFDGSTRVISGTPTSAVSIEAEYSASDTAGGGAFVDIDISVVLPPTVTLGGDLTGGINEGATTPITGTLTITNSGSNRAVSIQSPTGTYGSLSITGLDWTYTLDNADDDTNALAEGVEMTDTFTVTAAANPAATVDVVITVTGANDPPVAAIDAPTDGAQVDFGSTVTLTGSATDPDSLSDLTYEMEHRPAGSRQLYQQLCTGASGRWVAPTGDTTPVTIRLTRHRGSFLPRRNQLRRNHPQPGRHGGYLRRRHLTGGVTEAAATDTATGTLTPTLTSRQQHKRLDRHSRHRPRGHGHLRHVQHRC